MLDIPKLCGWRGIDDRQKWCARPYLEFQFAAPHLMGSAEPTEPILLYNAFKAVLNAFPNYPAQQIGDCVSFGHGHGNDLLQCIEIGLGESSEFRETDTEFIYGESRKVADILGPEDGSYGSAAVKAMTSVGMISREMAGSDGTYSGQRAKDWGRIGPPKALEDAAEEFKLGDAALVKTWDELVAAVKNGYPVTICTGRGFVMTRDKQGFCRASGTWGHCMVIGGLRFDRPGACILQSWGPDQPAGPTDLGQPTWSFWAEQAVIQKILAEDDSWALAKAPGFVERDLPEWSYDIAA